jgi:predicted DNA binding CopG/RHH family protein
VASNSFAHRGNLHSAPTNADFSQFKPAGFEFEKKDEQINMRIPKPLLAAVKARARARGTPYTRFIRETLERAIAPK